jgi:cytochrome P450
MNRLITPRLPPMETDTSSYYINPNSQFAGCPQRPLLARSSYGTEILSYDLIREAFRDSRMRPRDTEYFERLGASELILEFLREGNPTVMPPEKHDRIRRIMGRAFNRGRIDGFRPAMQRIANGLVDAFIDEGRCDLVADFSHMYPIAVFANFVGVPESDVPALADATVQLRMLGQVPFAPAMPVLEQALKLLRAYIEDLVAERRQQPGADFVDALIQLQAEGETLSELELIWGLVFLMLGGHDTTRFTLAGCFYNLITAHHWDEIGLNAAKIPDFITESMRTCPGTPRQVRLVEEPFELEGYHFNKGDVVSLNLSAAARDPLVFEDADEFRLGRHEPAYLIGFGQGRHLCLAQLLAKTEMFEAIAVTTGRLAEVKLAGDIRFKPTGVIAGIDSLPVTFVAR